MMYRKAFDSRASLKKLNGFNTIKAICSMVRIFQQTNFSNSYNVINQVIKQTMSFKKQCGNLWIKGAQ